MKIEQFEDKELAHYAYAILSECENKIVLIDPARNIEPYLAFAQQHSAVITGVIETHPHADFVSGHLELQQVTGATIYCSKLLGAGYPHQTFDYGDTLNFGKISLRALNTPGHSPDSICIVLQHDGRDKAVFTGDTLFIGDCGRPDLRETAGNLTAKREDLAKLMYHSLRNKLMPLDNNVIIYPAHGAGTLCGKALSNANSSTIGAEKLTNWSLQQMSEELFIAELLQDQPFVPQYFQYDVEVNKNGADGLKSALARIRAGKPEQLNKNIVIVDTRPDGQFKNNHLPGSVNLQSSGSFVTWLGSIIAPSEPFYLVAENEEALKNIIMRCAKIGYEVFIKQAFVFDGGAESTSKLDIQHFKTHLQDYTIIDIRNPGEVAEHIGFENAVNIPLPQLSERALDIPVNKPVVVHCAGGYRSAAGSSLLQNIIGNETIVYDLGEGVKEFLV